MAPLSKQKCLFSDRRNRLYTVSPHLWDVAVSCSIARDRQLQKLCNATQEVNTNSRSTTPPVRTGRLRLNYTTWEGGRRSTRQMALRACTYGERHCLPASIKAERWPANDWPCPVADCPTVICPADTICSRRKWATTNAQVRRKFSQSYWIF